MSRTVMEVSIKKNSVDDILTIIAGVLRPEGFQEKIVDNEHVWAKGDAVIMLMQCIQVTFTENTVIFQVWLKDAITGESDLEGFRAVAVKNKLKNTMNVLSAKITEHTMAYHDNIQMEMAKDSLLAQRPRFCSNCGNPIITEEAKFCRKCGYKL